MINKIICKAVYGSTSVSIYTCSFEKGASMSIQSIWYSIGQNNVILSMSTKYGIWWD